MNAVSHCNRPRSSSCAMIARQIRSHVPSSSQRFSRRQHVDGSDTPRVGRASERRFSAPTGCRRRRLDGPPKGDRRAAIAASVGGAVQSWPIARRSDGRRVWPRVLPPARRYQIDDQLTRANSAPQGVMKPVLGTTRCRRGARHPSRRSGLLTSWSTGSNTAQIAQPFLGIPAGHAAACGATPMSPKRSSAGNRSDR